MTKSRLDGVARYLRVVECPSATRYGLVLLRGIAVLIPRYM